MKKLIILLDEWNNDRNFIYSELIELKKIFSITIVCDDNGINDATLSEDIVFYKYKRSIGIGFWKNLFGIARNSDCIREIVNIHRKDGYNKYKKISETIRFYINSELFYQFLKKNRLIINSSSVIYYSYWNFWKCFSLTNHREEILKSKVVSRIHGYDLYNYRLESEYQPFKIAMDKKLDELFFISEYGMEYYHNTFGDNYKEKHQVKKLGVQNKLGISNYSKKTELCIVSCSRVIDLKRIDLIIEALSLIETIKIRWIHFGDGPSFEKIKRLANDMLGNKSNISYEFMGKKPNEYIMKYYFTNRIDVFILTSSTEGNPVSVIEAMSFGIPIIGTKICNMPNLVKENGILVSENPTPSELKEAIITIYNMSISSIIEMRKESRMIWEHEYMAEKNDKIFAMELDNLIV